MVRVAFAIDTHDREVMAWVSTVGAGISGEMVRDMMLVCVERRFDAVRAPEPVQWLADNGSAYTAAETVNFATALNLVACFTPVRSPESNGVCEAFVKTFKRDYVRVNPRPDAISVLQQLPAKFADYNAVHPHSGLRMLSPREFIAQQSSTPAACPSDGVHSTLVPDACRCAGKSWSLGAKYYNEDRPHGAIGQKPPISLQNPGGITSRRRDQGPKTPPSGAPTMGLGAASACSPAWAARLF